MNSLYFINKEGILTSDHGLAIIGLKSFLDKDDLHCILFSIKTK